MRTTQGMPNEDRNDWRVHRNVVAGVTYPAPAPTPDAPLARSRARRSLCVYNFGAWERLLKLQLVFGEFFIHLLGLIGYNGFDGISFPLPLR